MSNLTLLTKQKLTRNDNYGKKKEHHSGQQNQTLLSLPNSFCPLSLSKHLKYNY